MAVSVIQPVQQRQQQQQREVEKDPMDIILKGLNIASSIYGIKHAIDQSDLAKLQASKLEQESQDAAKKSAMMANPETPLNVLARKFAKEELGYEAPQTATASGLGLDVGRLAEIKTTAKNKPVAGSSEVSTKINEPKRPTSPGQQALDKAFAKTYEDWVSSGGYKSVENHIEELEGAKKILQENPGIVGPMTPTEGRVASVVNPTALVVKDKVLKAIQSSLKQTLGAQFTEKESENLFKRSYNGDLSADENIKKIDSTIKELRDQAIAKDEAAAYFEQNGTLAGFKKKSMSAPLTRSFESEQKAKSRGLSDFLSGGMNKANADATKPPIIQNGHQYIWNPQTGRYE